MSMSSVPRGAGELPDKYTNTNNIILGVYRDKGQEIGHYYIVTGYMLGNLDPLSGGVPTIRIAVCWSLS